MAVASARVSGNGHQMALGLDLRSSTVPRVHMTSSPGMIATVVERVADRDQLPVDAFEVAALIESFGITDDMAAQRYGVTDIFALAEAVLARIRSSQEKARAALVARVMQRNVPPVNLREVMALLTSFGISDREAARRYGVPSVRELGQMVAKRMRLSQQAGESCQNADSTQPSRRATAEYVRGPLAIMPSIFIVFMILMYAIVGQCGPDQVLALSLGMTSGILITNGFIYAMSRRCSIYLSLGRSDAAWRFLTICIVAGFVFAVSAATITFLGLASLGLLPAQSPLIFAAALAAVAMLWLLGAGLSLVEQTEWLTIALAAGLLAGAGINAVLEAYTVHHLAVATVLGFLTTVTVLIGALWWAYGQDAQPRSPRPRTVLPGAAFVIDEALPYFGYGLLYMAFVALPHVLGWAGIIQSQQNQLAVIARFELVMTTALAPFVLVGGIAERSLRLLWQLMNRAQKTTPATMPERFSRLLRQHYRQQLGVYLITLTVLSLITDALFQMALGRGMLSTWVSPSDVNEVVFIFRASLIAYWLAGWGAYNGVYLVTLGRAHMAAGTVALGIVVFIVAGLQSLVEYGFAYAPVAWIIGGIGFVLASSWAVGRILRSADYYFAASL